MYRFAFTSEITEMRFDKGRVSCSMCSYASRVRFFVHQWRRIHTTDALMAARTDPPIRPPPQHLQRNSMQTHCTCTRTHNLSVHFSSLPHTHTHILSQLTRLGRGERSQISRSIFRSASRQLEFSQRPVDCGGQEDDLVIQKDKGDLILVFYLAAAP